MNKTMLYDGAATREHSLQCKVKMRQASSTGLRVRPTAYALCAVCLIGIDYCVIVQFQGWFNFGHQARINPSSTSSQIIFWTRNTRRGERGSRQRHKTNDKKGFIIHTPRTGYDNKIWLQHTPGSNDYICLIVGCCRSHCMLVRSGVCVDLWGAWQSAIPLNWEVGFHLAFFLPAHGMTPTRRGEKYVVQPPAHTTQFGSLKRDNTALRTILLSAVRAAVCWPCA